MIIGLLEVQIRIPGNRSLKGKRMIVSGMKAKVRNRFNVSVSEVGDQNHLSLASLGIALVSNDRRYGDEVLSKVLNFIESFRTVEVLDYQIQLL